MPIVLYGSCSRCSCRGRGPHGHLGACLAAQSQAIDWAWRVAGLSAGLHNHVCPVRSFHDPARRSVGTRVRRDRVHRLEMVLAEVGAAAQPIDFIDWLLVKDIVDLTWEIQRTHLRREMLMRTERLSSLQTVIFSILYSENGSSHVAKNDPTVSRIAAKWARGDVKGSSASRNCSLRLGSPWPMSICNRYPKYPRHLTTWNGSTSVTSALPGVATRFCGKSSVGARAGRSWCVARARRLSKVNSMSCRRAHPTSRLVPRRPRRKTAGRSRTSSQRQGRKNHRKRSTTKRQSRQRGAKHRTAHRGGQSRHAAERFASWTGCGVAQ